MDHQVKPLADHISLVQLQVIHLQIVMLQVPHQVQLQVLFQVPLLVLVQVHHQLLFQVLLLVLYQVLDPRLQYRLLYLALLLVFAIRASLTWVRSTAATLTLL